MFFTSIRALGLAVAAVLVLGACTAGSGLTYNRYALRAYDGQQAFQVTCHGVFEGQAECMKRAQEVCGQMPVRPLERISPLEKSAKGQGDWRVMNFQCGVPPAAKPPVLPPPPPVQPPPPPPPPALAPKISGTVHFDLGKATLTRYARIELDNIISRAMKAQPSGTMKQATVDGYTDSTGTEAINAPLAVNRARAVWDYLQTHGVTAQQFDIRGHGPADPVESNLTTHGRLENRRVDIELQP
ncbi:OmpA family protein [Paraburkholderia humisilvae]|uniref:Peptidoglycan-associated lipoprotein n=1 Tax=Paraburkholderia humisilvae TaxID=627669 RepID=A0A6J5F4B6_9BURK|nr:OmpA family protein [Paraburkholderia humisilvae]CAB3773264.1 Peptidoglycan-associated lipoprotein [Paraburkholderia humisilvae]